MGETMMVKKEWKKEHQRKNRERTVLITEQRCHSSKEVHLLPCMLLSFQEEIEAWTEVSESWVGGCCNPSVTRSAGSRELPSLLLLFALILTGLKPEKGKDGYQLYHDHFFFPNSHSY
jgi:hypothetical protein